MATEYEYAAIQDGGVPDTFTLGVLAPPGYKPSPRQLSARIRGLLLRRRERLFLRTEFSEPVAKMCGEIARECSWGHACHGPPVFGRRRDWLQVATGVNALAVVHGGGPLPPDLAELVRIAAWIGVTVRLVVIGPEAAPL